MTNPFRVGDRVRRLTDGIPNRVVRGGEYTVVKSMIFGRITVEGVPGMWDAFNFELVNP